MKKIILSLIILLIPVLLFGLKKCPKCGKTFPDECEFCKYDGSKLVPVKSKSKSKLTYLHTNSQGYKEYKNDKDGSILIRIPAGEFTMGSNDRVRDEKPEHIVYLDEFFIGKYEVTNRQYKRFCDKIGYQYPSDPKFSGMSLYFTKYPDYPVVNVSWNDAIEYCTWAGLRLPTEAEWEKASRGTDGREFSWGNTFTDGNQCNFADKKSDYNWSCKSIDDGYRYTAPVANYPHGISPFGCYNMSGNIWEWCSDWYESDYYINSPKLNPEGPSSGAYHVIRGGSWYDDGWGTRCASRYRVGPLQVWNGYGFRLACSLR